MNIVSYLENKSIEELEKIKEDVNKQIDLQIELKNKEQLNNIYDAIEKICDIQNCYNIPFYTKDYYVKEVRSVYPYKDGICFDYKTEDERKDDDNYKFNF